MNLKKFNEERHLAAITEWSCESCGAVHVTPLWKKKKYCNNITCVTTGKYNKRIKEWLEDGKDWSINFPGWGKRWLAERDGYKCSVCDISEWQNKPIVLDADHIDGNHANNNPDNLRLICPNCHSQTPSYKNKNKGNGRASRRKIQ